MSIVILTAIGVGAATVTGAIIGFIFKKISHAFSDIVMSFAAGIMLAAAIVGLIIPSFTDYGGKYAILVTIAGIFAGAAIVSVLDKIVPHVHNIGVSETGNKKSDTYHKVMLFVTAIAIHNLPEGIAAGVGFGTENIEQALVIAGGIALQNVPEGMIIIAPMLSAGISLRKALGYAMITGGFEVVGTFIGYFAATLSNAILPFALAFAGGTMLYVISDEMIPETHAHGHERGATYALLIGFCVMLIMDYVI